MTYNAWREVLLEDVAAELTVGFVGSMTSEYVDSGIPFLRSKNVEPYVIKWQNDRLSASNPDVFVLTPKMPMCQLGLIENG